MSASAITEAVAYFEGLGRHCLPALQSAWDKSSSGKFSKGSIYKGLCKDFDEVGEASPTVRLFDLWAVGVERGEIERPARVVSKSTATGEAVQPSATTTVDPETRHVAGVLLDAVEAGKPVVPPYIPTIKAAPEAAFMAVKAAVGRLLEETIIQLSGTIERTARENTAVMLREVADELEGGAI